MAKANIRDGVLAALEECCPDGNVSDKILSLIAQVKMFRNLSYIAVTSDVIPVLVKGKPSAFTSHTQTTDAT